MSEPQRRRAPLLPALVVALIAGCDGGAPVEPTRPVHVISIDTLRPGQVAQVRGSGLTSLSSLLLHGVEATELVARSNSVAEFRVPSIAAFAELVSNTSLRSRKAVSVRRRSADPPGPSRALHERSS